MSQSESRSYPTAMKPIAGVPLTPENNPLHQGPLSDVSYQDILHPRHPDICRAPALRLTHNTIY